MKKITVVGCGMGSENELTKRAVDALKSSQLVIGSERIVKSFSFLKDKEIEISPLKRLKDIVEKINETKSETIAIAVSGDTSFFSMARLINKNKDKIDGEFSLSFLPGISSLSYFLSKICLSQEGLKAVSFHGKTAGVLPLVCHNEKLFGITSSSLDIKSISKTLTKAGFGGLKIFIGENLSYENERIIETTVEKALDMDFSDLLVFLIQNENPKGYVSFKDEDFIRGSVPMTKREIRQIAINSLGITKGKTVYDIGSGTGSVSCEIGFNFPDCEVLSFEKEKEAIELTLQNKERFDCQNIRLIEKTAPDGFKEEKAPDFAFVGGSAGKLEAILDELFKKNPYVRVCVTAISLNTLSVLLKYIEKHNIKDYEIIEAQISRTKKLGSQNLLFGANPVFVVTFGGKEVGKLEEN